MKIQFFNNFLFNSSKVIKVNLNIMYFVFILNSISFAMLYSATGGSAFPWMYKQVLFVFIGLIVMFFILILDPFILQKLYFVPLLFSFGLIIFVAILGIKTKGGARWIDLGFLKLQPSEFLKISCILFLAGHFGTEGRLKKDNFSHFLVAILCVSIPVFFIIRQPDLATGIMIVTLSGLIIFLTGVYKRYFIYAALPFAVLLPFFWYQLKGYQKQRIANFLNPEKDIMNTGYNVYQSKIAIGSGGFFGKGLLRGDQNQLSFLPESHTDFIFTMIGEEFGFLGCLIVATCYIAIFYYAFVTASKCSSLFNKTLCYGASLYFFLHFFINTSMTIGLLPVAGIPLVMISYGGSSVVCSFIVLGFIMHAEANQTER